MTTVKQKVSYGPSDSPFLGFVAGGIAACGAVTFTNPIEIVKTRMQLQGELVKAGAMSSKAYLNPLLALISIGRREGFQGLQKGLVCAYLYQIGLNGCRLGLYDPMRTSLNKYLYPNQDPKKYQSVLVNIACGTLTGALGAVVVSPLYLVKTRMQSYAGEGQQLKVGQQTKYNNFASGLKQIYLTEGGIKGLFRGCDAAILRTAAGSSVQLPLYNLAKSQLKRHASFEEGPTLHLVASCITGLGVGFVMNPFDVVLTRVYNQRGNLYSGPLDCLVKTLATEGPTAFLKGLTPALLRLGPHTILTLTFMESTMVWVKRASVAWNEEKKTLLAS